MRFKEFLEGYKSSLEEAAKPSWWDKDMHASVSGDRQKEIKDKITDAMVKHATKLMTDEDESRNDASYATILKHASSLNLKNGAEREEAEMALSSKLPRKITREGYKSSSKAEKEANVLGYKTNKYRQFKNAPTLKAVQNQEDKIERDLGK